WGVAVGGAWVRRQGGTWGGAGFRVGRVAFSQRSNPSGTNAAYSAKARTRCWLRAGVEVGAQLELVSLAGHLLPLLELGGVEDLGRPRGHLPRQGVPALRRRPHGHLGLVEAAQLLRPDLAQVAALSDLPLRQ